MAGRQVAAHVPEFLQVRPSRVLGRLDTEGGVASRAGLAGDMPAPLRLIGQGEEHLGGRLGVLDGGVGKAVVRDHREAVFAEGGHQGAGEGGRVLAPHTHGDGLQFGRIGVGGGLRHEALQESPAS